MLSWALNYAFSIIPSHSRPLRQALFTSAFEEIEIWRGAVVRPPLEGHSTNESRTDVRTWVFWLQILFSCVSAILEFRLELVGRVGLG